MVVSDEDAIVADAVVVAACEVADDAALFGTVTVSIPSRDDMKSFHASSIVSEWNASIQLDTSESEIVNATLGEFVFVFAANVVVGGGGAVVVGLLGISMPTAVCSNAMAMCDGGDCVVGRRSVVVVRTVGMADIDGKLDDDDVEGGSSLVECRSMGWALGASTVAALLAPASLGRNVRKPRRVGPADGAPPAATARSDDDDPPARALAETSEAFLFAEYIATPIPMPVPMATNTATYSDIVMHR